VPCVSEPRCEASGLCWERPREEAADSDADAIVWLNLEFCFFALPGDSVVAVRRAIGDSKEVVIAAEVGDGKKTGSRSLKGRGMLHDIYLSGRWRF
jgi:hypothetical protein